MANRKPATVIALGIIVVAAGVGGYFLWRSEPPPSVVGVVRTTEVRVAPEVGGGAEAIPMARELVRTSSRPSRARPPSPSSCFRRRMAG